MFNSITETPKTPKTELLRLIRDIGDRAYHIDRNMKMISECNLKQNFTREIGSISTKVKVGKEWIDMELETPRENRFSADTLWLSSIILLSHSTLDSRVESYDKFNTEILTDENIEKISVVLTEILEELNNFSAYGLYKF